MDWGLAFLGGGYVVLWIVLRAVLRWFEVRAFLRTWGPGPHGASPADRVRGDRDYARMPE